MRAPFYPLPMVLLLLLCCCTGGNHTSPQVQGDTIRMAYAENITITDYQKYKVVELANPWKRGHLLHRYVLIDSTYDGHTALPEGATVVRVPLRRAVVFNAAHANLFVELRKMGAIAGVADLSKMLEGKIPDLERTAALQRNRRHHIGRECRHDCRLRQQHGSQHRASGQPEL